MFENCFLWAVYFHLQEISSECERRYGLRWPNEGTENHTNGDVQNKRPSQNLCKLPNGCKINLHCLKVLLWQEEKKAHRKRSCRKWCVDDIRIKDDTDINVVMCDMMSVLLEGVLNHDIVNIGWHFFYKDINA